MVWKLFGKKKESAAAMAPETATSRDGDVLEDTTNAMVKVKQSMMDLQAKIDRTQKEADAKFEEARKIREENPNDPRLKTLLKEIADKRKELDSYRSILLNQSTMLAALDNAAFLNEMTAIYEETKNALERALEGIHEKMEKLMEGIDDSIDEIKDIFDMMTERPEEEDNEVQDLFDEMDAKNAEEKSTAAALPSVPTVSPAVPAAQSAQEDERADLDMALAEL